MANDDENVLPNTVHDDAESEDNQAGDIPPPTERSETFAFISSREFLLLRWLLRGLSLWHPRSSCSFSHLQYLYPILVNSSLAFVAVWTFVHLFLEGDFTLNVSLWTKLFFFVQLASAWSSHLAGCLYFRSRDFEKNMMEITLSDAGQLEEFREKIICYYVRVVISSVVALVWLVVNFYYHSSYQSYVINVLLFFLNAYVTGMYFAVLWVIDILQLISKARLRNQRQKFLKWTQGAEAAIKDHICNYTTKVETSCRRLRFWFFIHNVSLSILVPIVVMSNLADGASLKLYTVALVGVYILTIWAGPLYFAEQMGENDERFCCEVNNFCPAQHLTFGTRTEVQLLVDYLKNIRSGFLAVGYTFQLKLSIIAAIFSIGAQVFKTDFEKNSELAMLINNMTSV